MTLQRSLLCGTALCLFSALAQATPIGVTYLGGEVPVGPGTTATIPATFPALLGGAADIGLPNFFGDTLFLKFRVENMSSIENINSLSFSVQFIDDEVDGGETAEIAFAQPSSNLIFTPTFTKLGAPGTNAPVLTTLTYSLSTAQIAQVLPSITSDGNFRIRIERLTGDFNVLGGSAQIDATFAPEPGSALLLLAAGLCIGAGRFRFNRRTA